MHRLGCSRVFALCFTLSCSLRLSVWLSINACRQLLLRSPRYVKRPDGCGRQRPSWISDCAGFSPLAATNGFRLRFRVNDDSRRLAHARRRSRGATTALPQSETALKVLCEPHCAPSIVNAQLEECPVLLIIGHGSFGINNTPRKHQSRRPALTAAPITAARNPGALKAA